MKKLLLSLLLIIPALLAQKAVMATHSMGLDLTYECLGGNQYVVSLVFYRDCEGIAAPTSAEIDVFSMSCGQSYTEDLPLISVTELNTVCASLQTTCSGGTYPGAEEYIYSDTITLPQNCTDWTFAYDLCCRNNAINTINDPGDSKIYVEAELDNTITGCNSSPVFSNIPVPFVCVGGTFCFNNGANDSDGDSLAYSLITPTSGPLAQDTVDYVAGYDSQNPISSTPGFSLNPVTGDICMSPTVLGEVSVMQVLIEEYRNGAVIGRVERDIQLRVVNCPDNTLPTVDGINGTGVFSETICANEPYTFFTNSVDPDATDSIAMSWDNGINDATFNISGGTRPVGTFSWTPTVDDINGAPHCFTVEVVDDNCPFLGSQIFSFCLTVEGVEASITSAIDETCFNDCDGSIAATQSGGVAPYTYLWGNGQNSTTATGLCSGSYILTVTDNNGCKSIVDTVIGPPTPVSVSITSVTDVSCKGFLDGVAVAIGSGGTAPYTYSWESGGSSTIENGLAAGVYTVSVYDNNNCEETTEVTITEPATSLTSAVFTNGASCKGGSDGSASVSASGGIPPYSYLWQTAETSVIISGLTSGNYSVTVSDATGCEIVVDNDVSEPTTNLSANTSATNSSCNSISDASITVTPSGGVSPYTYSWEASAGGGNQNNAAGLSAGTYLVSIEDANGCVITTTDIVTEPSNVSVQTTITQATCGFSNGEVDAQATGGTPPYSYSWVNTETTATITGLPQAIYQVTVFDNNGCESGAIAILNNIEHSTTVSPHIDVTCNGEATGEATLLVSGGLTPYQFLWSNGYTNNSATGLLAGTYQVTVLDANSCTHIESISIAEPNQITITQSVQEPLCFGAADGSVGVSVNGATSPFTYFWDSNADNQSTSTASGVIAGSYSVTITDNNNCTYTQSVTVGQPNQIDLDTAYTPVTCFGINDGTASVSEIGGTSPYTYLWNNGQINSTAIGLISGSYQITVTDNNNCFRFTQVTVTEPAVLSVSLTPANETCGDVNGSISTQVTGGVSPYSYQWNNGQVVNDATALNEGNYVVSVTDFNGCLSVESISIADIDPTLVVANTENVLCFGNSTGIAEVLTEGGLSPYNYVWSNGATDAANTGLTIGVYNVTLTDGNNCIKTESITISQPTNVSFNNSSVTDAVCFGDNNGTATLSPQGGVSPYVYLWDASAFNQAVATAINLQANTYSVTVIDNNNCDFDTMLTVGQPMPLMYDSIVTNASCFGGSDASVEVLMSGGTSPYQYNWGANVNGIGPNAIDLFFGTYQVTITDNNGCSSVNQLVISHPTPVGSSVNSISVGCFGEANGQAIIIGSGGTSPYTYQWDVNAAFQNSSTATALVAGIYYATVTDANGCINTNSISVSEPSPIMVVTTPPADTICLGESVLIGAMASGGSGGYSYAWGGGLGNGQSHNISPSQTTSYTVFATDNSGCLSEFDEVTVNVVITEPQDLVLTAPDGICPNQNGILSATFNEEYPPYTYNWEGINASGTGDFTIQIEETTTYYVTITDFCGVSINDSISIEMYEVPEIVLETDLLYGCAPYEANFTLANDSLIAVYSWDFGDGFQSNIAAPLHEYEVAGDYVVELQVTLTNGCITSNSGINTINVFPNPIANFTATPPVTDINSPEIAFDGSVSSSDVTNYLWFFEEADSTIIIDPTILYPDTGTYQVTLQVTNQYNCTDEKVDFIRINPYFGLDVPNAFVPDPNGSNGGTYDKNNVSNSVFFPFTDYVDEFHLMIFNRWGELIFESFNLKIGWDGYYRGELCQQDVYVWKVNAKYTDGTQKSEVGEILLIR